MNMIQGYPRTRGSAAFIRGKARPGCQGILTTEHLFKDTDNPLENRMTCYQGINFLNWPAPSRRIANSQRRDRQCSRGQPRYARSRRV